ncbi:MAG: hypothetical protein LBU67_04640 [Oscillospiraceae bacterium]|jgi:hypothetical protein|nr:hypothetical protein [Oscillospiraceae bacterium]
MYYTYKLHTARPRSRASIKRTVTRGFQTGTAWVVLAVLLVCAALGWVAVQICNSTQMTPSRGLSYDMPRNVVDMRNAIYSSRALPASIAQEGFV